MRSFKTNIYACSAEDTSGLTVLARRSRKGASVGDDLCEKSGIDREGLSDILLGQEKMGILSARGGNATLAVMAKGLFASGIVLAIELEVKYCPNRQGRSLGSIGKDLETCDCEAIEEAEQIVALMSYDPEYDGDGDPEALYTRARRICDAVGCDAELELALEDAEKINSTDVFSGELAYTALFVLSMCARLYDPSHTLCLKILKRNGKTMMSGSFGVAQNVGLPAIEALRISAQNNGMQLDLSRQGEMLCFGVTPYYATAKGFDVMYPQKNKENNDLGEK